MRFEAELFGEGSDWLSKELNAREDGFRLTEGRLTCY